MGEVRVRRPCGCAARVGVNGAGAPDAAFRLSRVLLARRGFSGANKQARKHIQAGCRVLCVAWCVVSACVLGTRCHVLRVSALAGGLSVGAPQGRRGGVSSEASLIQLLPPPPPSSSCSPPLLVRLARRA
eukprot:9237465-Pyramimonas_sp.AAC.1